jgi:hypothetical protein
VHRPSEKLIETSKIQLDNINSAYDGPSLRPTKDKLQNTRMRLER